MSKIWKNDWYMSIAFSCAERATCERRKVWCVIVKDWVIISTGINWNARGEPECIERWCIKKDWHCSSTIHAENNAIINAARVWVSTVWCIAYVTDKPCDSCTRVLINAWITEVYYSRDYKNSWSIDIETYIKTQKI